MGGWVGT